MDLASVNNPRSKQTESRNPMCRLTVLLLCGGRATRMRPLSSPDQPKSMVPFMGRPLLEHLFDLVEENGFSDVVLTSSHPSFQGYLGEGAYTGKLRIRCRQPEGSWQGTAACAREVVRMLGDDVSDPYVVIYGDSLMRFDLAQMVAFHRERHADATLLYHRPILADFLYEPVEGPEPDEPRTNYGVLDCDDAGAVTSFHEKPRLRDIGALFRDPRANATAYVVARTVTDKIIVDGFGDFAEHVFPEMISRQMRLLGFSIGDGFREDVGTLDRYLQLHLCALSGALPVPGLTYGRGPHLWVANDADVSPNAVLVPPVMIGPRCRVAAGARLDHCCLMSDVHLESEAVVIRSVIHPHVHIGSQSRVTCSVLGDYCRVAAGVTLPAGTVAGAYSIIGDEGIARL